MRWYTTGMNSVDEKMVTDDVCASLVQVTMPLLLTIKFMHEVATVSAGILTWRDYGKDDLNTLLGMGLYSPVLNFHFILDSFVYYSAIRMHWQEKKMKRKES